MKTYATIIVLIFLTRVPGLGQIVFDQTKIPDSVITLCNMIAADSILKWDKVGHAGIEPQQWSRYEKLKRITSDTLLFELTNYVSPVVRGYAFIGLIDKRSGLLIKAIRKNENDTTVLFHQWGCMVSSSTVIDFAATNAFDYYQNKSDKDKEELKYLKILRQRSKDRLRRKLTIKK